jgi:hypothetical protein
MKEVKQISEEIYNIAKEFSSSLSKQKPYVTVLQPRRSFKETPAQNLSGQFTKMIDLSSISASYHAIDGNPVDVARCYLVEKAIEDDAKYLLFVDEDTVLPFYGAMNLIKTSQSFNDEKIITGIYYIKFGPPMHTVIDENGYLSIPDVTPNSGLIRNIVNVGLGCALIPMKMIKKLKENFVDIPLFCVVSEKMWNDDSIKFMGEDTWFYNLCRRVGIEVVSDTSCHCLHMELATGKYEAHPDVKLYDYVTNIQITERFTMEDRNRVSKDYHDRIQKPYFTDNNNDNDSLNGNDS